MGGYNIKYGAMDTLYTMTSSQINEWYTQLGNWASSYNEMVELESFQGISAANAKSYLQEVHGLLICALQQAMSTYQSCLLLYKDGYYGIEDNIYASLPQEVIKNITTRMGTESTTLTSISDSVNGSLESISDIISIPNPTMSVLMNTIVGVKEELTTFDSDIESYETEQSGVVNGDLKSLLDSLQRSVSDCLANGANIVSYTPGSIAGNTNMLELYDNVLKNAEYINNNKEEIEQAAADLEAVYAQMRADYEAACEARKDQGTANMIMGGAAIVLGAVVIFATVGMATPVVVTAGVTAGSTIVFGASNFAEGAQDFYYGCVGNLDSAAINPIRDTIFASNPDLYYVWGEMNMMVAGMCIPAGQVINGFAGQGGKVLLQETLKVIVKDQVKDYAFDWASGEITNFATENLHLNQTQSTLLNLGLNFGMDKGSDFIGQKGHFSNTMAEGMSYDDALRYNQHWSDLENGTYNHHPGMSDADIASWDFANGRLDEHLAIQQVDPNAVMDLRLKELETQNKFLNAPAKDAAPSRNKVFTNMEAEEQAFSAIHGTNKADAVVLGKFDALKDANGEFVLDENGKRIPTEKSYNSIAEDMDAQYFQMDNWDEIEADYSDTEIWKINEKFLDIQTSSGREVYLSSNPKKYLDDGSFYGKEIRYLVDNGYRFVKEGDIWHAIR